MDCLSILMFFALLLLRLLVIGGNEMAIATFYAFHAPIPLADSLQSKLALTKIVIANNGRSLFVRLVDDY